MINRRQLLGGMGSLSLLALFRSKRTPSMLVELPEEISEEQILEEYDAYPSAVDMVVIAMGSFRPRRLVVPELIAPLWVLENITIGKQNQFASDQPIGAEFFTPNRVDNDVFMDTVSPGMEIRMRVRRSGPVNVKAPPEVFRAAFFGNTIDTDAKPCEKHPILPEPYDCDTCRRLLFDPSRRTSKMMALPISSDPYQVIP